MITQRPQKLHKDALTSADTLIAMRVLAPQDRAAVEDWIKGCGDVAQGKQVLNSLASLQRGEGWVWYPEGGHLERVRFPAIATFDSSATPTDGHAAAAPVATASIDLSEIKAALADATAGGRGERPEAAARADRGARAEGGQGSASGRAGSRGDRRRTEPAGMPWPCAPSSLKSIAWSRWPAPSPRPSRASRRTCSASRARVRDVCQMAYNPRPPPAGSRHRIAHSPRRGRRAQPRRRARSPKGEQLVLTAIAQHSNGVTREQLTVLTGYKRRSTRDAYLQRLRERALIDSTGDVIVVTRAGVEALGKDFQPLPTGRELLTHWLGRLPEGERRVLEVIVHEYPGPRRSRGDLESDRLRALEPGRLRSAAVRPAARPSRARRGARQRHAL